MINELPIEILECILYKLAFKDLKKIYGLNKELNRMSTIISSNYKKCYIDYINNSSHNAKKLFYSLIIEDQMRLCKFKNTLTDEQKDILQIVPNKQVVVVQAYAGTGKTTTLEAYCKQWNNYKILCISFNKSVVSHLKNVLSDLKHVTVEGFHKMAFKDFKTESNINFVDKLKPHNIQYNLTFKEKEELIKEFSNFCYSCNDTFNSMFKDTVNGIIPYTHDSYLKKFQLKHKQLDFDIILVDEAQDCNDCMADIIMSQKNATRIFFGDIYQNINTFRNRDNDTIISGLFLGNSDICKKYLSVSFRYGGKFGCIVNEFLKSQLGSLKLLYTIGTTDTKLNNYDNYSELPEKTTIICRLNRTVLDIIFNITQNYDKKYNILKSKPIDFDEEIQIHKDFIELTNIDKPICTHPKLKNFDNIYDAEIYFRKNNKYKWMLRSYIHEIYPNDCWELAKRNYDKTSNFIISNTHQSKGMEFENVALAKDFCFGCEEFKNIFYTAVTRVKHNLFLPNNFYKQEFIKPHIFNDL